MEGCYDLDFASRTSLIKSPRQHSSSPIILSHQLSQSQAIIGHVMSDWVYMSNALRYITPNFTNKINKSSMKFSAIRPQTQTTNIIENGSMLICTPLFWSLISFSFHGSIAPATIAAKISTSRAMKHGVSIGFFITQRFRLSELHKTSYRP